MSRLLLFLFLAAAVYGVYQAYQASQAESKEVRSIRALPPSVQHVVAQMPPPAQSAFFAEYENKRKKVSVGYLLWLIGFHYLYYRKVGLFFAYWLTAGGFFIWILVDVFRMPSICRDANEQIARQALQTLGLSTFVAPQFPGNGPLPQQLPPHAGGPAFQG